MERLQPKMKLLRLGSRKTYLVTFAAWLVTCLAFNGWRIHSYINNPKDLDQYAHNWSFGLFVFALFYLPIWIIGLLGILAGEIAYFARRRGLKVKSSR